MCIRDSITTACKRKSFPQNYPLFHTFLPATRKCVPAIGTAANETRRAYRTMLPAAAIRKTRRPPLSATAIRTASPRPSRYRRYAVRKTDTAEQVLRRICFKFRPGRPHNDRHGHPVARHQISPFSFFSRTARSISSVMDFISHFGFQPHSSRAQVSSRLSGQLRAMDSLTGSTS